MARREKASSNVEALPSVKLFVAATGWPYKPTWSPQFPTVILTGGCADPPRYLGSSGHTCKRHSELICALMRPEIAHNKVFVVDLSVVATSSEWHDELDGAGRATRMFYRWFAKFNPSKATVVVHAEDMVLLDNMMQLHVVEGGKQSWLERVLVVGEKPPPKEALQHLSEVTSVELVRPSLKAVAAAATGSAKPPSKKVVLPDLNFASVEFRIDPTNKQLLQTPHDITADVTCPTATTKGKQWQPNVDAVPRAALKTVTIDELDFGMRITGMVVQVLQRVEAGDMDLVTLGDPHATVEALVPRAMLQDVVKRGLFVAVDGHVVALDSRLFLAVEDAEPHSGFRRDYTAARVGQRNVSRLQHRYGCLVLRGARCALAKDESGQLSIPMAEPFGTESKHQTAKSAFRHVCRVNVEELALLSDVAPAVAYEVAADTTQAPTVLTIFAATAASAPPADAGGCGDDCCPTGMADRYGWYSFEEALAGVCSESARVCLMKVTHSLAEAAYAGILSAGDPLSTFRPVTPAIHNDLYFTQVLSLAWQEAQTTRQFAYQITQPVKKQTSRKAKAGLCCGPGKCGKKGCC